MEKSVKCRCGRYMSYTWYGNKCYKCGSIFIDGRDKDTEQLLKEIEKLMEKRE